MHSGRRCEVTHWIKNVVKHVWTSLEGASIWKMLGCREAFWEIREAEVQRSMLGDGRGSQRSLSSCTDRTIATAYHRCFPRYSPRDGSATGHHNETWVIDESAFIHDWTGILCMHYVLQAEKQTVGQDPETRSTFTTWWFATSLILLRNQQELLQSICTHNTIRIDTNLTQMARPLW
jgi:hypothetical protein